MRLQLIGKKRLCQSYSQIFETPSGIKVAKTKHGYYPVTRDGQINKKRRYAGKIDEYEVWEHSKQKRVSVCLREI
jgi:hypothetical protein